MNEKEKKKHLKCMHQKIFDEWKMVTIPRINQVATIISGEGTSYVLYKDYPRNMENGSMKTIYNNRLCSQFNEPPFTQHQVQGQSIMKIWMNHRDARTFSYSDCVFETENVKLGPYVFNRFTSLAITQDEAIERVAELSKGIKNGETSHSHSHDELENFQSFLKRAWCENDEMVYDYVVKWLAHQIQYPGHKINVTLVLMGVEGCGKGSIIQIIGKILGSQYFFHPTSHEDVWGSFNYLLQDRFLIYMDEMFWGGDKANRGNLIKLISEDTITINKKFASQKVASNRFNMIFASNESWVIPATPKSRRFCVLNVTDEMVHLSPLERERIWNIDPHLVARWLYAIPLEGWNAQHYPKTAALTSQKLESMSPLHKWWIDYLSHFTKSDCVKCGEEYWMSRKGLFDHYISSSHAPTRSKPTAQGWWREFKVLLGEGVTLKRIGPQRLESIRMPEKTELMTIFEQMYDGAKFFTSIEDEDEEDGDNDQVIENENPFEE